MKKFLCLLLFLSTSWIFSHEIKAIIFDCGGVVVSSNQSEVIHFLAESFGIAESEMKSYLAQEKIADLATGKIKESIFWENFAEKNHLCPPQNFYHRYLSFIKDTFIGDPGVIELVKWLKASGFQTPMLSDVTEWQACGFRQSSLYDNFSFFFLSYEIGLKKPDPAIFEYLLSQLNLSAKDCIFIDDRQENIDAARKLGIDALCFTNLETLKQDLEKRGIYSIRSN